jgi:hypothetical protein
MGENSGFAARLVLLVPADLRDALEVEAQSAICN